MTKNQKATSTKSPGLAQIILGFLLFTFLSNSTIAQEETVSLVQLADSSLGKAIKTYDIAMARNSFLFTGRVYNDKYRTVLGHQFFKDDYWDEGMVWFKGQQFDSVNLMYEIFNDELLVESFTTKGSMAPLKLHGPDVSAFTLFGHTFVRLLSDSAGIIREGFYDVLYDGDSVQLYARRKKEISKTNDVNTASENFIQKDRHFILKGGQYYPVKSKGSVFKALEDHKKELKKFVKTNLLSYSIDHERSMIEIARYYDSLK
jgi:hypothetical protein